MSNSDDLARNRTPTQLSNESANSGNSSRKSNQFELTFDMESEEVNESERTCIFDENGRRKSQFQPPIDVPMFSRDIVIRFQNSPDQIRNTKIARLKPKHMINRVILGRNKKIYPKKPIGST